MMTKEEAVAFGEDVAARLRGEEPVADIAALVASKIADVAAEDFVTWCRAVVDGVPASNGLDPSPRHTYRQRQTDINVLLVKVPAFSDSVRRYHAWNTAPKDK